LEEFKADALDGDGDGFVQDGTEWERPAVSNDLSQEESLVTPEEVKEDVVEEPEAETPAVEEEDSQVISTPSTPKKGTKKRQAIKPVSDGVIGTSVQDDEKTKVTNKVKEVSENTVAIYSARNVRWEGVGKINKGYNIIDKKEADLWIGKLEHVRLATPEEVSRNLG
jgi:hypothetical protein